MERAREKVDRLEGESQFAYIAFVPKSFKKIMNMFACKRPVCKRPVTCSPARGRIKRRILTKRKKVIAANKAKRQVANTSSNAASTENGKSSRASGKVGRQVPIRLHRRSA